MMSKTFSLPLTLNLFLLLISFSSASYKIQENNQKTTTTTTTTQETYKSENKYSGSFSQVYAFGGSGDDTGNAQSMESVKEEKSSSSSSSSSKTTSTESSSSSTSYSDGRMSNGNLVVDYLCKSLDIPPLPPYSSKNSSSNSSQNASSSSNSSRDASSSNNKNSDSSSNSNTNASSSNAQNSASSSNSGTDASSSSTKNSDSSSNSGTDASSSSTKNSDSSSNSGANVSSSNTENSASSSNSGTNASSSNSTNNAPSSNNDATNASSGGTGGGASSGGGAAGGAGESTNASASGGGASAGGGSAGAGALAGGGVGAGAGAGAVAGGSTDISASINFSFGINFAISGTTLLQKPNITNPLFWVGIPPPFQTEIDWFKEFLKSKGCTDATDARCKGEVENALFWLGAVGVSDYSRVNGQSVLSLKGIGQLCILHITKLLQAVLDAGAKYIVVQGLPPVGCLPVSIKACPFFLLDKSGCSGPVNGAIDIHNKLLVKVIEGFRLKYPNSTIVYANYWKAFMEIFNNGKKYKMEEKTKACCGAGEGNLNFDPMQLCGTNGAKPCKNPEKYISWDGIHFTDAMNMQLADLLFTDNYCEPPFYELVNKRKAALSS